MKEKLKLQTVQIAPSGKKIKPVASCAGAVLCGHTETERGYLKILQRRLWAETNKPVKVLISKADAAPLKTV